MVSVAVTLERPSPGELEKHGRAQKYETLKKNSAKARERLIEWIKKRRLGEEVAHLSEPTSFNLLFITCTPRVAEELQAAPGVIRVSAAEDIELELPSPAGKHST